MIYRYFDDGFSFDRQPASYEPLPGDVLFAELATPEQLAAAFPAYAASVALKANAAAVASYKQQLADLDGFLPRALEDYWAATSFDTTKLPKVQQERLAEKQSLRSQLASGSA